MRYIQTLGSGWSFSESDSPQSYPATVPGCVHLDLHRNGLIPDPFWGSNELELQWIEERDWTYRCEFSVTGDIASQENIELVADGIDTLSTLVLNGITLGDTNNMFVGKRFLLNGALKSGANCLEVSFHNPMAYIKANEHPGHFKEPNDCVGGSSYLRKAPYAFGWDWGPRFVTCGVYREIRIEGWSHGRIEGVRILQDHSDAGVRLDFHIEIVNGEECSVKCFVKAPNGCVIEVVDGTCHLENPDLWWPNGHGKQPLYELTIHLIRHGVVIDTRHQRIGLRTVTLDRHADQWGESFQFVINGRAIFAKGANWIPPHSFLPAATPNTYDHLITSAVSANMNMLRIWGGGVYETEQFYNLCDEKGLLVWQDFMFACALYPGDAPFLRSVEEEAKYQVRRLEGHPCLALWCGSNEIEQWWKVISETEAWKAAYQEIFYDILPTAVRKYGSGTGYWPSSPHNPDGYEMGYNSEHKGDNHYWGVWHERKPVKAYEDHGFRFCSEFGMQSYSSPEVALTFCDPENLNVLGPAMENHQKNAAGNQIILDYLTGRYRFPKDYESLAYLSQLNQAYSMKVAVEHFRRSSPRTMGALFWQLNDCWPGFSWSSIEFGGNWKALHYEARRFFASALVSVYLPGREITGINNVVRSDICEAQLHVVYDFPDPATGTLRWALFHMDGRQLDEGSIKVELRHGHSTVHKVLDLSGFLKSHGARNLFLSVDLVTDRGHLSTDCVFLTEPRFIEFEETPITKAISRIGESEFEVSFLSQSLHHQVHWGLQQMAHQKSDSFFDLLPGREKKVIVSVDQEIGVADLKERLWARSLVHTY